MRIVPIGIGDIEQCLCATRKLHVVTGIPAEWILIAERGICNIWHGADFFHETLLLRTLQSAEIHNRGMLTVEPKICGHELIVLHSDNTKQHTKKCYCRKFYSKQCALPHSLSSYIVPENRCHRDAVIHSRRDNCIEQEDKNHYSGRNQQRLSCKQISN